MVQIESRMRLTSLTLLAPPPTFAYVEELKQRVRTGYSRPWGVSKYSTVGLWPSEETLCSQYFTRGSRLLDLGCGAGRTTVPLSQAGYKVVGIALATPMVGQARRFADQIRATCYIGAGDATDLPLKDELFDGILFSYNGIELIPREIGKLRVLAESHRVLKLGGHLIFTTHAFEALNRYAPARLQRLTFDILNRLLGRAEANAEFGEIIPDPDRTVEVYYMQINSPRKYRKLLKQSGFELVYYNSRSRIDAGRRPNRLADFDADFKFYVARKID